MRGVFYWFASIICKFVVVNQTLFNVSFHYTLHYNVSYLNTEIIKVELLSKKKSVFQISSTVESQMIYMAACAHYNEIEVEVIHKLL